MSGHFRFDPDRNVLWAGDRPLPADRGSWGQDRSDRRYRQVHVHCENGFRISVMWGDCMHGSNYDWPTKYVVREDGGVDRIPTEFVEEPAEVECAVKPPGSSDLMDIRQPLNPTEGTTYGDVILGYATPDALCALVDIVSSLASDTPHNHVIDIVGAVP